MDLSQDQEALIKAAMASATAAVPAASSDPRRPVYHYHAPAQWMNDPNGPVYHRGWYHVFYQFNPYGSDWGHMHWGHARSKDLVNWQQLPVALGPSKGTGEDHVFSGSVALRPGNKPIVFYTSIGDKRDPEQWAAEAENDDLLTWRKLPANPVLSLAYHGQDKIAEWRDPYLFTVDRVTYMVIGGGLNGRGVVTLYRAASPDLVNWQYLGVLFQHPDPEIKNVECPNIVPLNGKWLLLTSTHGRVESFVGSLDLERPAFITQRRDVLTGGSYASQLLTDSKGHCVHLAWVNTSGGRGWNGYLTLPSVLSIAPDATVLRRPVPALAQLRRKSIRIVNQKVDGVYDLTNRISGNTLEIIGEIDTGDAASVLVKVGVSTDGTRAITLRYDVASRTLFTEGRAPVVLPASPSGRLLELHLFLDKNALEVYAAGGAVSQSVYYNAPHPSGEGIQIVAERGTATLKQLQVFEIVPATFDHSLYR